MTLAILRKLCAHVVTGETDPGLLSGPAHLTRLGGVDASGWEWLHVRGEVLAPGQGGHSKHGGLEQSTINFFKIINGYCTDNTRQPA